MNVDIIQILTEEMDEETLSQMPSWFRRIREAYKEKS
jgi:hypothetical protein